MLTAVAITDTFSPKGTWILLVRPGLVPVRQSSPVSSSDPAECFLKNLAVCDTNLSHTSLGSLHEKSQVFFGSLSPPLISSTFTYGSGCYSSC